jgi:ligand-binding SRPBCC domain-containing protein
MESFEARVELPCSVEEVFDLVARPEGIKKISPPEMGLYFMNSPVRYALGTKVEFKVQAMGLVREIVHQVTAFTEPQSFTEEQVSGPFRHWVHEHFFEAREGGGSVVIDRIQFLPPGGVAGMIMTAARILDNLEDGFDYRHEQLERHFGPSENS